MRVVVDPATGEQLEVLDADLVGGEPYDYAGFRRASMTISREHRAAIDAAEKAGKDKAKATVEYRKALAVEVMRAKANHGATNAEAIAKGSERVAKAHEDLLSAEAIEKAAMERVRLARDDRTSLSTMGAWSRSANADGWDQ